MQFVLYLLFSYICSMKITAATKVNSSGIYLIKNVHNKKMYVGSALNIHKRIFGASSISHIKALKAGTHINQKLQNAWNKYGESAFEYEVLELCEKENLLIREQCYLDTLLFAYDSKKFNELAYNICPTAGSPLGRKSSEATKQKLSLIRKGVNGPMYGKINGLNPRTKKLLQYDKHGLFIKEWESINICSNMLNIPRGAITNSIRKGYAGNGFYWKYYTKNYSKKIKVKGLKTKVLVAYDPIANDLTEFESVSLAAKYFKVVRGSFWLGVKRNIDKKTYTYKGYKWYYKLKDRDDD